MKLIVLVFLSSAASAFALPRTTIEAKLVIPHDGDQEARELEGLYLTRFQRQKLFEKFDDSNRSPQRVQFPVPLEPGGLRLEGAVGHPRRATVR